MRGKATWLILTVVGAVVIAGVVDAFRSSTSSDRPSALSNATATVPPSPTATVQDVMELAAFDLLEPGTYFVDPDGDPSTPLRVVYEVPMEGWSQWPGGVKFADYGHIGVSIVTVTNVVRHGCHDHRPADPAVGPSVGDLATALADLAPFRVTSPPEDATIHGYSGKYLELTVPDLPVQGSGGDRFFPGCEDEGLMSWIAPLLYGGFHGYNSEAGRTEELWILDVDGTRLVIAANWSPASPRRDVAEMRTILDSIRIEP